jgi:vacuolar protein sorting-associated protein 18
MEYDDDDTLLENNDDHFLQEETVPKFEMLNVAHEMEEGILCLDIQNDVTAILGVRGTVIIRDAEGSSNIRTTIKQPHKIFLHPSGTHCFASSLDGTLHYYNVYTKKAQAHFPLQAGRQEPGAAPVSAINVAESVLWSHKADGKSTGTVLLGTKLGGSVFEVKMDYANAECAASVCRQIAQIPRGASCAITGIDSTTVEGRTVVFLTTPTRFYKVEGTGDAKRVLVDNAKQLDTEELPATLDNPARGSLSLFRSTIDGQAQSYAWANSMGIAHGLFAHRRVNDGEEEEDLEETTMNHSLLALHRKATAGSSTAAGGKHGLPDKPPSEVLLTAFHMILLYEERFIVLGHPAGVTWKPANETELQEYEIAERIKFDPFRYRKQKKLLGVLRDGAQRRIYIYNSQSVWELFMEFEHFTQWRLFLERAMDPHEEVVLRRRYYHAAYLLTCKDPQRSDLVQYSRGMFYMELKNPKMATTVLAQCNRFEDIYTVLSQQKSTMTLRMFLEKRYHLLVNYRKSKRSMQSQIATLAMHLVQLKLEYICKCEGDETKIQAAVQDLDSFLSKAITKNADIFEDKPFYQMVAKALSCQGRIPTMLLFAELLHRVHYTVSFYLSQQEYAKACDVLLKYCTKDESYAEAWYDFCPIIIVNCPVKLITGLLRAVVKNPDGYQYHMLEIERLIPAFIRYHPKLNEVPNNTEHQVIVFLERCIEKLNCDSTVVHNYYISLLAQYDPDRLADLFAAEDTSGQFYTTEYALRRCLELHRFQQCIPLYRMLGLYEDAICIAMECSRPEPSGRWAGLTTAKQILEEHKGDMDFVTKKKLWTMVAQRVIDQIGTRQALSIVEESKGILKLEDVLTKINDSTVIQNFKEAVCKSLDEYTSAIADLNAQQREAFQLSEGVKRDIRDLKNRYGYITTKQKCHLCQKGLLHGGSPFLVYPSCRHVFHEACVVDRLQALGGLQALRTTKGLPLGYLDDVYSLEDLAQAECVFCGECAVLEITKDFYEEGVDMSWNTD